MLLRLIIWCSTWWSTWETVNEDCGSYRGCTALQGSFTVRGSITVTSRENRVASKEVMQVGMIR